MNEQSLEIVRRREFGQRVRSLRKKNGLNRQQLADRTNIPFKTIGNVERGEKVLLNVEWVVKPLADCFGLAGLVREEFFAVAGLLTDDPQPPADSGHGFDQTLDFYRSTMFPAFIMDALYTIRSSNSYLNAVYELCPADLRDFLFEGAGPNLIRFLFDPKFGLREKFGGPAQWRAFAEQNLYLLRINALRYLGTPTYENLMYELHLLPGFPALWNTVCDPLYVPQSQAFPMVLFEGTPRQIKAIVTYVFATRFTGVEQYMILYLPADTHTTKRLEAIQESTELLVYQYSRRFQFGYREVCL